MSLPITFTPPLPPSGKAVHHAAAAELNARVAEATISRLHQVLAGDLDVDRLLLKAAAGAGKSHLLKQLVQAAADDPLCSRLAVVAFQNRQLWPLAVDLGKVLGARRVCMFSSAKRLEDAREAVGDNAVVVASARDIPTECEVIVATSHKLGNRGEAGRLLDRLGPAANGSTGFDLLFVDEAWQLADHLFDPVKSWRRW